MITALVLLVAIGILGWGFYRAKPYGKVGILSWLQSVALMAPWLIFFGLFAAGIYLNLIGILVLLVISTGVYIFLGNRLRTEGRSLNRSNRFLSSDDPIQEGASDDASSPNGSTSTAEPQPSADNVDAPQTKLITEKVNTPEKASEKANGAQPTIPDDDLKSIQGIFGIDTFFVTDTVPYQDGVFFKGNLRGEPDIVYERLSKSLAERMGDRYRLFLVEGSEGRPTMIALPSTNDPNPTTTVQAIVAALLAIATIVTCAETVGLLLGFDVFRDATHWADTLPLTSLIVLVLAVHEIGHRVLAKRHNISLSPPFFIPTLQIGSFGALTRFESLLPNRNILFDIAFAGPAAGGVLSLGLLVIGLVLSHQGSLFQVPTEFFQGSILVGTLARVILGSALQQPLVDIHPFTMIGWLGLVITAINLMPAGQLDGGRIVQSIYGRKVARRATIATLIVLGIATLANPLALYWAIVILFIQRDLERPSLNELSEPDDARAAFGLLALFLMAAILLPLTPGLSGRLGIGG
ncbi:MAG TPA: site-2 protease family protein [Elainellaceae cyanobacterium]